MRKTRHHIHRVIRRSAHWRKGHPVEAEICVTEDTALRDGAAIVAALVVLGGIAMAAEHAFALNADVCYGVATSCGGHPLTLVFRKLLASVL